MIPLCVGRGARIGDEYLGHQHHHQTGQKNLPREARLCRFIQALHTLHCPKIIVLRMLQDFMATFYIYSWLHRTQIEYVI